MQKICSLLLLMLVGYVCAGKKEGLAQKPCMHEVIDKYHLMSTERSKEPQRPSTPDVAFGALIIKCKKLKAENETLKQLNEELRQHNEKLGQPSSTESSPSSAVAISPTNEGDEPTLLSPDAMHLATPESKRVKSPVQHPADARYYYEYPTNSRISGMSPGFVCLEKLGSDWNGPYSYYP